MFYLKELFKQAFEKIRIETGAGTKNAKATKLSKRLDPDEYGKVKGSSSKNLTRLYDKYVKDEEIEVAIPDSNLLSAISRFLGYKNYEDFVNGNQAIEALKLNFRDFRFTYDEYLYKVFTYLREDQKLFSIKVGKMLKATYPSIEAHNELFDYVNVAKATEGEELRSAFIILNFSQQAAECDSIEPILKGILEKVKKDKERRKDAPLSYIKIIANIVLTKEELNIIDLIVSNYEREDYYLDFFDIEEFILYVGTSISIKVYDLFFEKNLFYRNQAFRTLNIKNYYPKVPFEEVDIIPNLSDFDIFSNVNRIENNPSQFIKRKLFDNDHSLGILRNRLNIEKGNLKLTRKTNISFIISEFGFGKTSLLLYLTSIVPIEHKILYLPTNQLSKNCFQSTNLFVKEIYSILYEKEFNQTDIAEQLKFRYLRGILLKDQSVVLFFDGLDEHIESYSLQGLKRILNCLESLEADCVVSVRKEFWDDRTGDLSSILKDSSKYGGILLKEWSSEGVLKYIEYFMEVNDLSTESNIIKLKEVIKNDNYERLYGDIPKRPLFLNMIIRDSLNGMIESKNLKTLYKNYLNEKFAFDRKGVFEDYKTGRQLRMEKKHDRTEIIQVLQHVLKIAASKMMVIKNNELLMNSHILESTLKSIITNLGYSLSIREILLNTVLISFSRRTIEQELKLYFAHKSFQEYYLAMYLKEEQAFGDSIKIPKGINVFLT
ncbi:NACHT domain-containing protein [Flavivirga rizhaonensis]|uniref:NACHT domain-containing protein n=1 Tax=Flavivirga rizhaonensis TaxID=2559571 RepID=A0A4S1DUQ0_9FLAO|nr:hypothetical protein [Flavivirga rizhaonensis]TGV01806.1 hypothetical protein EM932_14120 [Flavivirga rizhaonensis]